LPYSVPAGFGADALQQEHYRSPTNVRTLTPNSNDQRQGIIMAIFVLYPPVLSWESVVYSSWFNKSEVVNLELEVLKMKIIIIFIDLLMATVLFFVGRFFIKSRNTERSVLFLSGDYTGLNTEKICRVTGKRIKTWAMLFCLGGIIDFIKLGAGIIIVSVFFIILLVFHLVDMTINRDKYRA
jgi:hypothetical protein